jgi:membrane-bound lytic murein transglycosylase A
MLLRSLLLIIPFLLLTQNLSAEKARAKQTPALLPTTFEKASDQLGYEVDLDIWKRRTEFINGIDDNLQFINSDKGTQAYRQVKGTPSSFSQKRVAESLSRFRMLLVYSRSAEEFRFRLQQEFKLYRSRGKDGRGTVIFTGYFQPSYPASRVRDKRFRYPIFAKPPDFEEWKKPHPTRIKLEGYDGLGMNSSLMHGREIAFLENRWDAFMVHVQGSAILNLENEVDIAVGFAAGTDYPFRGITRAYMRSKNISWTGLREFFIKNPSELDAIISKNNRFIFFKENSHTLPIGSLGVPVIAERSIATDKIELPPGALGLIHTRIPIRKSNGRLELARTTRLVLDQDTGSAIKGPGRVDIFMGTGHEAQERASSVFSEGALFYLVLK